MVVGGGNSAVDAARWARRLGSETTILFRRGRAELRARLEEIEHAEEEGVRFEFLAAPVRLIGDEAGGVREVECIRMRLGEPDASGRPAPVPIEGSEFRALADTVVAAIGQSPNPTLSRATPQLITKRGKIVINSSAETSIPHVFAGGDAVRGGSTVILAMSDGRAAAVAIDAALKECAAGCCETPIPGAPEGNRIIAKRFLTPEIVSLRVEAPQIAQKWRAGQFVIVQVDREGERIPLTIVNGDAHEGTILLVVQAAGKTTRSIVSLEPGHLLYTVVGPLGEPATIESQGSVLCVGGGVGVAELAPVARAFREAGKPVTALCGARSTDRIILRDELEAACDEVLWATDDGSSGFAGNVVDLMRHWRESGARAPALVHVIGPIPMMSAVAELTRQWGVRTYASLNPIMVDGTGMCGGCRVTVGGKARFACVEGP
jgi:NAD(P)H-flavin reductase